MMLRIILWNIRFLETMTLYKITMFGNIGYKKSVVNNFFVLYLSLLGSASSFCDYCDVNELLLVILYYSVIHSVYSGRPVRPSRETPGEGGQQILRRRVKRPRSETFTFRSKIIGHVNGREENLRTDVNSIPVCFVDNLSAIS